LKIFNFSVGIQDTAVRIIMKKYYNDDEDIMVASFKEFEGLGCDFLVAGRVADANPPSTTPTFATLNDISFPTNFPYRHLFSALPSESFRNDISSTQIRRKASQPK